MISTKQETIVKLQNDDVTVIVNGNMLVLNPVRVRTEHTGRQVRWTCTGGNLEIAFKNGVSPFKVTTFSAKPGHSVASGECKIKNEKRVTYDYTITVHPSDGGRTITIDPQVDVDNPGAPIQE